MVSILFGHALHPTVFHLVLSVFAIVCFLYFPFAVIYSTVSCLFFPCFRVCKLIVMFLYVFFVHCYMYITLWSFCVVCISFKSNYILLLVPSFRSIKIEWDSKLGKQLGDWIVWYSRALRCNCMNCKIFLALFDILESKVLWRICIG